MKFIRLPALLAVTALAFTACSREDGEAGGADGNDSRASRPWEDGGHPPLEGTGSIHDELLRDRQGSIGEVVREALVIS